MSRAKKIGLVLGGYGLAVMVSALTTWAYEMRLAALPYDTSGGMYAGGSLIASLAVFLMAALFPTLLALWFLRSHPRVWQGIAVACLAFAAAGLAVVLLPLFARWEPANLFGVLMALLWLGQLLGVPLWAAAFALFAFLAPTRPARRLLVVAVGLELAIGVCAAIHWLLPRPPL